MALQKFSCKYNMNKQINFYVLRTHVVVTFLNRLCICICKFPFSLSAKTVFSPFYPSTVTFRTPNSVLAYI